MNFEQTPPNNEFDDTQFINRQVYEDFNRYWKKFTGPNDEAIDLRPALFTKHVFPVVAVMTRHQGDIHTGYRIDFDPDVDETMWQIFFSETMPKVTDITILSNKHDGSYTYDAYDQDGNYITIGTPDILMLFDRLKQTFDFERRQSSKPTQEM